MFGENRNFLAKLPILVFFDTRRKARKSEKKAPLLSESEAILKPQKRKKAKARPPKAKQYPGHTHSETTARDATHTLIQR